MNPYAVYVRGLERVADEALHAALTPSALAALHTPLNGGAYRALQTAVTLAERKRAGAFFTGQTLREAVVRAATAVPALTAPVLDPACGAGDLLLAYAQTLPVTGDLESTLETWGELLHGYDLHEEFVRATRARLVLHAVARGARPSAGAARLRLTTVFPGIRRADALAANEDWGFIGALLLNPPYVATPAPQCCVWGSGAVSASAVFLDRYLDLLPESTRVGAILPDVLRTGSRLRRWRAHVAARLAVDALEVHGRFDAHADVDVFVLAGTTRRAGAGSASVADWWRAGPALPAPGSPARRINDLFEVRVGPVVPHRHKDRGLRHPYLHARIAPAWGTLNVVPETRGFEVGPLFAPPFIVVRRTSSPHDPARAVATLVVGSDPVAVENHLLVLQPRDGSVITCRAALAALRAPATTAWFNERIRCRHLTVEALRELPWPRGGSATADAE